jgi:hypothetical protein
MSKGTIAVLFSILFLVFIAAPLIIIAIDDTVDVSILYNVAEEENEIITLPFPKNDLNDLFKLFLTDANEYSGYYFKNYPKPHLNIISPPPDQSIF